jgi:hypothetical protein
MFPSKRRRMLTEGGSHNCARTSVESTSVHWPTSWPTPIELGTETGPRRRSEKVLRRLSAA